MSSGLVLGTTRNKKLFTLTRQERATHMQVVGASGRGKSKLLEDMIRQDIEDLDKPGLLLLDPHGTLYDDIAAWCAWMRIEQTRTIHLINPSEEGWAVGFNPLRLDSALEASVRIDAMVQACAQVWGGEDPAKTPLLKKCLRAVFYALAVRELTLLEATELVSAADPFGIRRYVTHDLGDRVFQAVWDDFNDLADNSATRRQFVEQFSSTNNRLMEFLAAPVIRNIVGQRKHVMDFRQCMDNGEIVLVNLTPSTKLSLDNAKVLGTLIISDLLVTALGRDRKTAQEHPFYLYIDECYDYLNNDIEKMLDQTRKFGLHLILSHQRLGQLSAAGEGVYNAVMAGAQTKIVFGGLEAKDAEDMAANIFLGELDLEQRVRTLDKPTPTGEFVRETLFGEIMSETQAESAGGGTTTVEGTVLDADGEVIQTNLSLADLQTYQTSYSRTHGRSEQEALRSVYETMPTAVQPLEKTMYRTVVKLVNQRSRQAFVKIPGRRSCRITTRAVEGDVASEKRVQGFTQELLDSSAYVTELPVVEREISDRYEQLKETADKVLHPPEDKNFKG